MNEQPPMPPDDEAALSGQPDGGLSFSRRAFFVGSAAAALMLAAPSCETSRDERFEAEPDWGFDFTRMPDGQPLRDDWNYEMGTSVSSHNGEAQAYTDWKNCVRIENGLLVLQAHKIQESGQDYVSARINTQGTYDFTYGKVEAELRAPIGVGTWPAVWLMPSQTKYMPEDFGQDPYQTWPLNGEIDIMEAIGTEPGAVFGSVHTLNNNPRTHHDVTPTRGESRIIVGDGEFHTYGVEWLPDSLTFTLDKEPYFTYRKPSDDPRDWPFDQPYHVILNLAMGGSWGGEARDQYPPHGIDDASAPWKMEVKSIHHYPFAG